MAVKNGPVENGVLLPEETLRGTTTFVRRLGWLLLVLVFTACGSVALISAYVGDWPWRFHWLDNGEIDPLLLSVVEEARVHLAGVFMLAVFGFAFALLHNSHVLNRPAPMYRAADQDTQNVSVDVSAHPSDLASAQVSVQPGEHNPPIQLVQFQQNPESTYMQHPKTMLATDSVRSSMTEPNQQHIHAYFLHTPALIKAMQRAYAANRQDELLALLHSLTLHSQSIRFQSMEACCRQLQQSIIKGRVKESAKLMVELPILLQDKLEREDDSDDDFGEVAYSQAA